MVIVFPGLLNNSMREVGRESEGRCEESGTSGLLARQLLLQQT